MGPWVSQTNRATKRKERSRQVRLEAGKAHLIRSSPSSSHAVQHALPGFLLTGGSSQVLGGKQVNCIHGRALTQLGHGKSGPDP